MPDDLGHDRQPQPRSGHVLVRRAPPEPVGRPLQFVLSQPGTVVADRNRHAVFADARGHLDGSAGGAELERVVQQRVEHDLQPARRHEHARTVDVHRTLQ